MDFIQCFDHIGIAVRCVDESLRFYRDVLGGKVTTYKAEGTTKDYTFTQFSLGGQTFELIEPVQGISNFLTRFLEKYGEGLHHLTFRVDSLSKAENYLESQGMKLADESLKDSDWKTVFISPSSSRGVLIQLYETTPGSQYDHSKVLENK